MSFSSQLIRSYPIISDQIERPALEVVLTQLEHCLKGGVSGDIVEFGCYIGTTSLFIRRLLDAQPGRRFHAYDSFAGLPEKSSQDASAAGVNFTAGQLHVSKKQLLQEFHKARLQPPIIHKAWFGDLTAHDVPDQIAFGFLDGDFYGSMIDSLRLVWPRLAPGGRICLDDYQRETLPGVERSVRDFFQDKPAALRSLTVSHNIATISRPS